MLVASLRLEPHVRSGSKIKYLHREAKLGCLKKKQTKKFLSIVYFKGQLSSDELWTWICVLSQIILNQLCQNFAYYFSWHSLMVWNTKIQSQQNWTILPLKFNISSGKQNSNLYLLAIRWCSCQHRSYGPESELILLQPNLTTT